MGDEYEILRLADDGCPHVSGAAAAATPEPDHVVDAGPQTYCLWVPFGPATTGALIPRGAPVRTNPLTLNGRGGTVIETEDAAVYETLYTKFYPKEMSDAEETAAAPAAG